GVVFSELSFPSQNRDFPCSGDEAIRFYFRESQFRKQKFDVFGGGGTRTGKPTGRIFENDLHAGHILLELFSEGNSSGRRARFHLCVFYGVEGRNEVREISDLRGSGEK